MRFHHGLRLLHSGLITAQQSSPASKSQLAKLRKKTGYTFSNCKKALELHSNDLEKAERWLSEQAQTLGWSKATKLDGRPTAQGLVAVTVDGDCAAIVEVNCETDFVARNEHFQGIVRKAVAACATFGNSQPATQPYTKISLDSERLRDLASPTGTRLCDELALVIGSVGENLSLRRASCFRVTPGMKLASYAHPSQGTTDNILLGKYGALIAFKQTGDVPEGVSIDQVGKELCQHVVGMSPLKVGVEGVDEPCGDPENEKCIIHQEFLLDSTQTVAQVIAETGITVLDFVRFECGEKTLEAQCIKEPPLNITVEQCG